MIGDTVGGERLDESHQQLFEFDDDGNLISVNELADSVSWSAVQMTPDGGAILSGNVPLNGHWNNVIEELGPDLNSEWHNIQTIDSDYVRLRQFSVDQSGNIFCGGYVSVWRDGGFADEPLLMLLDNHGNQLWQKRFFCPRFNDCTYLHQIADRDGRYWMCGSLRTETYTNCAWVMQFDSVGDSLWQRTICFQGDNGSSSALGFAFSGDVGALFTAHATSDDTNGTALFMLDTAGEENWFSCSEDLPEFPFSFGNVVALHNGEYLLWGAANAGLGCSRIIADFLSATTRDELPHEIQLHPNYPNPFNATTEITFDLPRAMRASLKVYDVLGREVAELAGGVMNAGSHTIIYDASGLSSGVYFYRLEAGKFGETRKMVFLK